jgi:FKBP-type peptidyl-prolyl cis-trans isomerase
MPYVVMAPHPFGLLASPLALHTYAEKPRRPCSPKDPMHSMVIGQVHYTGSLDSGEVFDSSREREPMAFQVAVQCIRLDTWKYDHSHRDRCVANSLLHATGWMDQTTASGATSTGTQVGAGRVIAGFDAAVTGLEVGGTRTQRVPPEQGYGMYLALGLRSDGRHSAAHLSAFGFYGNV